MYLMPISFCISSHSQHEPTALRWRNDLDTHPDLVPGDPSLSLITALCLT